MTKPPVFATFGCRLNTYETEAMKELTTASGLENAVVVNTCAVTAEAVRHGVCLAQAGAVALALERAAAEPLDTYFCGGGGEALMAFLEIDSHYCADLVFEGLELAAGEA